MTKFCAICQAPFKSAPSNRNTSCNAVECRRKARVNKAGIANASRKLGNFFNSREGKVNMKAKLTQIVNRLAAKRKTA